MFTKIRNNFENVNFWKFNFVHVAEFSATKKQCQKTAHWWGRLVRPNLGTVLCDGPQQMFEFAVWGGGAQAEYQGDCTVPDEDDPDC